MFDFRYHALSLAAVLLALAVGVVIGVAIGDSNLVSSAKSGIVHDLSSEVSGAQHQAEQLRAQLGNEEAFANDLYPIAVRGLLSGRPPRLLSAFDGHLGRLDGLVVMRNDPTTLTPEQATASQQFETGLIDGVAKLAIPVVGVELSGTEPSQIPWYQGKDLAS